MDANEKKLAVIDTACDLLIEANERLVEAEKLLKKYGIDVCCGFNWGDAMSGIFPGSNVQIWKGVKNMAEATGSEMFFRRNTDGTIDQSTAYLDYRGLRFCQLGNHSKYKFE